MLTINCLGPFEISSSETINNDAVTEAIQALMAYLVMNADKPLSRQQLAALFWPEHNGQQALTNLRQILFRMNRVIPPYDSSDEPYLLSNRQTIQWNPHSAYTLDLTRFTAVWQEVQNGWKNGTSELHPEWLIAAKRYRGEFLSTTTFDSIPFEDWHFHQQELWSRRAVQLFYWLAEIAANNGNYEQMEHFARKQLEIEPWREEAHQQLMRIYLAAGDKTAVLQQYNHCRQQLENQFDIPPSAETETLLRLVRAIKPSPIAERTPLRVMPPHNLPRSWHSLYGRNQLLHNFLEQLKNKTSPLYSITGPGGIGKTSFCLAAGRQLLSATFPDNRHPFADGIWFVPLEHIQSSEENMAEAIASAILNALSHQPGQSEPALLLTEIAQDKEMLIILDNFEQLVNPNLSKDGVQYLLQLQEQLPQTTFIISSRRQLNISREQIIQIPGLTIPEIGAEDAESYSSIEMFLNRAIRFLPTFTLTKQNINEVITVCQILEGVPLSIELATSQLRYSSMTNLLSNLQNNMDILQSTMQDIPERHQSQQAVFNSSWKLLNRNEKYMLTTLAAFKSSFTWEAVAVVTAGSKETFNSLQRHHLIERNIDGRFKLPSQINVYAARHLTRNGRELVVQQKFASYYVNWAAGQIQSLRRGHWESGRLLSMESANLLYSWKIILALQDLTLLNIAATPFYWFFHLADSVRRGERAMRQAAEMVDSYKNNSEWKSLHAYLRYHQITFLLFMGNVDQALEESIRLRKQDNIFAAMLSEILLARGNYLQKRGGTPMRQTNEAFKLASLVNDREIIAQSLNLQALIHLDLGQFAKAEANIQKVIQYYREEQDLINENKIILTLTNLYITTGKFQLAMQELTRISRFIHHLSPETQISIYSQLGEIQIRTGNYEQAIFQLTQAIEIADKTRQQIFIGLILPALGYAYYHLGEFATAANHYRRAERHLQESKALYDLAILYRLLGDLSLAQNILSEALASYDESLRLAELLQQNQLEIIARTGHLKYASHKKQYELLPPLIEAILPKAHITESIIFIGFDTYLSCINALEQCADPRYKAIVVEAHNRLQKRAVQIANLQLHNSFLVQNAINHKINQKFTAFSQTDFIES